LSSTSDSAAHPAQHDIRPSCIAIQHKEAAEFTTGNILEYFKLLTFGRQHKHQKQ